MTTDFLTAELKARYGQFMGEPNETQLTRYFHLDETDLAFISERRGAQNRLGFALQLTSVRFLGTFASDFSLIPANVQKFVAAQLSIGDISVLADYAQRKTTKREHTALIRKQFGYREFNEPPWGFRLSRLLYSRAWISNERPSLMFDFASSWLAHNKVLLPGVSTLSRLITEIRERTLNRLYRRLFSIPTAQQRVKLEALLCLPEGTRISLFESYRKGPVSISAPSFNAAVDRYSELKAFGLQKFDFHNIPLSRFKSLARHAGVISMYSIARMTYEKRIAVLVAFVKAFEIIALDDALDILDLLIGDVATKAKRIGQKKRLRSLADLDKSALALADTCALILNDKTTDNQLRQVIFSRISKDQLAKNIATVNELARPSDDKFQDEMIEQYG